MAKRRTTWEDTIIVLNVEVDAAGDRSALDGGLSQADAQGLTLTRCIGDLSIYSNTVAGAWGVQDVAIGIGMSSREAFTAETLPSPNSLNEEPARGWVYKNIVAASQNGVGGQIVTRVLFDIRAKRRLDSGRMFIKIVNVDIIGTAFDVRVRGLVRSLFLLA